MSLHASQLVLDELAAGLPVPPETKAHVEACPECTARLAATRAAREASEKAFGYSRTKARVTAHRPSRLSELMPFLLPVIAALVFFIVISIDFGGGKKDTERLKGGASIAFVSAAGQHVTEAKPGTRLSLEVGAAGNSHALVLSVDKDRAVEALWSGELPPGAIVKLPVELEVTPGPVAVHLFLSRGPLDPKRVVPAMQSAIQEYGGWPLEAPLPKLEGVTTATQRLHVTP